MERPHFDIVASGARMRQIRRQRQISVRQVTEYMGFESMQAVYKWEAGKCFPQADNLIALAMLYQVNPIELLVKEGDEMSSSCFLWKIHIPKKRTSRPRSCGGLRLRRRWRLSEMCWGKLLLRKKNRVLQR